MPGSPPPPNSRLDPARLEALRRLMILDSTPEHAFDDLVRLLASSLGVPIAMVNLLDVDRDWFKAVLGFPMQSSPSDTSICETFLHCKDDIVVVEDMRVDPGYASHPLVQAPPHVRFYAAARLQVAGHTVGTLCAYDLQPRSVTPQQIESLRVLAQAAVDLLNQRL